jgi:cyclophilin family peptidyl-prolyl cis-trans isomerase
MTDCNIKTRFGRTCRFTILPLVLLTLPSFQIARAEGEKEAFEQAMRDWKATYLQLVETYGAISSCEEAEFEGLRDKLLELKRQGDELEFLAVEKAAAAYLASEQNIEEIKQFLLPLPIKLFDQYRYGLAATVNNALLKHDPRNTEYLFDGIKSAFFSNQFDLCADMIERWRNLHGELPQQLEAIAAYLPDYRNAWKEQEQRVAAAATGLPLPQLELETEIGTIVIELDEDSFPIVVNNLVNYVVERSLYRGFKFFEVLEHQVARSGCPANNGTSMVNLATLNPELMGAPRRHFRGTFSVLVNGNTGAATTQFYICRIPMPEFDGRYLPIGRVISGMDVVDRLAATVKLDDKLAVVPVEGATPNTISGVRILHKRDHEYKFRDEVE